ncbi:unnamed protein product [Cunninghamella blakesleeana]
MFSFNKRKQQQFNVITNPTDLSSPTVNPKLNNTDSILNTDLLPTNINVLLVGQIYQDTILYMDEYPEEDHKIRAKDMEQRRGGNISNTAEVLCQFPRFQPWCMSALGSKEASSLLVQNLEDMGIKTKACIYRKTPLPSSYIIQSSKTGTRTIISHNKTLEISKDEFVKKIEFLSINKAASFSDNTAPFSWVHFEGRNVDNVVNQVDWLDSKATEEGWRSQIVISIEMEKPDRENIDLLLPKGDVLFFSKLFAERRGYNHPNDFLRFIKQQCKPSATLFCTWGESGASAFLSNGKLIHASALPVHDVIDPVGAGDTFIAGIIFCLSRKLNTLTALKFACEIASRKVAQKGFDGLAEIMCKLWEASLNAIANPSSSSSIPINSLDLYNENDLNNNNESFQRPSLSSTFSTLTSNSKSPLI